MSDEQHQPVPTVRSRLGAVLSEDRVSEHLGNATLRLDGRIVVDLDMAAPAGTRIIIAALEGYADH
jgi:hypothetical protein